MTDEQNPMPSATRPVEPSRPQRHRLSVLLRDVPPNECGLILERFEAAVMKGIVKALPLQGQYFGKVVVMEDGKKKRCTVQDEAVVVDEQWHAWLAEQRRESRYRSLQSTGVVDTTIDRLRSGEDDFERMLEIRRKKLKAAMTGAKGGS